MVLGATNWDDMTCVTVGLDASGLTQPPMRAIRLRALGAEQPAVQLPDFTPTATSNRKGTETTFMSVQRTNSTVAGIPLMAQRSE